MDNTLVFYIAGDNGGSSIGDINGTFNEWSALNGAPEDIPYLLSRLDEYGGPNSYPNYSIAWAMAGATPATWSILMTHGGGNMAGMVVKWPKGIEPKGEIRRQYTSLIDIAPTILQAAGIPEPKVVNGAEQIPMSGTSMIYAFNDGSAKERHRTQYNESMGNRSIYHDGWLAATVHILPWKQEPESLDFATEKWELYHMDEDFGLATNVAAKYPEKLEQMKALWLSEAKKNNVLPLDRRKFERLNPVAAGRPDLMFGRKTLTLYPGMTNMTENGFMNTKAVSYTITAELEIPKDGAEGVILSQAGMFGGWSLYVKDGKPNYAYNWLARETYTISGEEALPESGHVEPLVQQVERDAERALELVLLAKRPHASVVVEDVSVHDLECDLDIVEAVVLDSAHHVQMRFVDLPRRPQILDAVEPRQLGLQEPASEGAVAPAADQGDV